MGCLFELIFEIIFEGMLEGCVALMQWIIPEKTLSKKTYRVLKVLVVIFACVLFMSIFIGIFALISDDNPYEVEIGKRMVFIPLAIIVVQILIGVIVRKITKNKENKE